MKGEAAHHFINLTLELFFQQLFLVFCGACRLRVMTRQLKG